MKKPHFDETFNWSLGFSVPLWRLLLVLDLGFRTLDQIAFDIDYFLSVWFLFFGFYAKTCLSLLDLGLDCVINKSRNLCACSFFLVITRFSGSAYFCFVLDCLTNGIVIDLCRKKDATYRLNPTFQLNIQNHIVHGYIFKSFLFLGKRGFWFFTMFSYPGHSIKRG